MREDRNVTTHRYKVGQQVRLSLQAGLKLRRAGVYQVVALLPASDSTNQYRVRNPAEPFDRVVGEAEVDVFSQQG
jgi:hypothetical protein